MTKKRPKGYVPRSPGRPAKYPWKEWFDGESHLILPGQHFDGTLESMRQQIYTRARKDGVVVEVRRWGTGLSVKALAGSRGAGGEKYDWDTLLDGQTHVLRAGHDFSAAPESFRQYARRKATEHGGRLRSRLIGQTLTLRVEYPKPAEPLEPNLADLPFEIEES